jgi:ubiquinone/menaquinone biosynthesis C-methylase UbiE
MCLICQQSLDPAQLDSCGAQFLTMLNHSAAIVMISVGHRTGLLEAMRHLPPSTSVEIAEAAELNERYVREWLGGMTAAGIVECDDDGKRFHLPPAQRALLTEEPGADNLAPLTQWMTMTGSVEEKIVRCFREGGGVPYEAYPRFHDIMAAESRQTVVGALFDHILPLIPGIQLSLHNGIRVLDVGCGRGYALLHLAQEFPASHFVGYDLNESAIEHARDQAEELGLKNITFEVRDLSRFDRDADQAAFDLVTAFDAIHDQARPDHVLAGIRRTLRPGGVFLMQDIGASSNVAENRDHPLGPLLYTMSCMHCMTVSLAQGGLGLGAMWGETTIRHYLAEAGFKSVDRHILPHDIQNHYFVSRP